jgi:hypothetical protein
MKTNTLIIIALATVSIIALGSVYAINSDEIKSYAEGTSFQGHSEGKYGPAGVGGYGPPEIPENTETEPSKKTE